MILEAQDVLRTDSTRSLLTASLDSRFQSSLNERRSPNRERRRDHAASQSIERLTRLAGRCLEFDICVFHTLTRGLSSQIYAPSINLQHIDQLAEAIQLPVTKNKYVAVTNLKLHPDFRNTPWVHGEMNLSFMAGHVIRGHDEHPIGSLTGFRSDAHVMDMDEMRDFREFALLIQEQLRLTDCALKDPLTGLLNRRAFDDILVAECHRSALYRSPLHLAIADIDHFKVINDSFGHDCGDEILVSVAEKLRGSLTGSASEVSRLGGEEFALILPDQDAGGAGETLDRLRRDIQTLSRNDLAVSISIGFSGAERLSRAEMPDTPRRLLKEADKALYWAKGHGRNRVQAFAAIAA